MLKCSQAIIKVQIFKSIDLKVGFVPKGHSKTSSFPDGVSKMFMNVLSSVTRPVIRRQRTGDTGRNMVLKRSRVTCGTSLLVADNYKER